MGPGRSDTILKLIAAMKLVKCAALVAGALGALSLLHRDGDGMRWIDALQPDHHYLRELISRASALEPQTLELVGAAMLIYAGLFLIEGLGLLKKKVWAEYMTTIVTTSFIPLEVYEAIDHASLTKACVIAVNLGVVAFLVWRLHRERHWPFRLPTAIPGAAGA